MKNIPRNFQRYKQLPLWENKNIPKGILEMHNTKIGVYGKINVLEGKLKYTIFEDKSGKIEEEIILEKGDFGVAEPQKWHKVTPIGNVKMYVEFFSEKDKEIQKLENEFINIFKDKVPHYEVYLLAKLIKDNTNKKVLDLGSGYGRNSLFLAKNGFKVFAWDKNLEGLLETANLAKQNGFNVNIFKKDLNKDLIEENFDIIIATVSLQFLEKESATNLLKSATEKTNIGGYNLIIVPILSEDVICPINFPNLRKYEEYLEFYKSWEIIYSGNLIGRFHRKDENGKEIISRFATILAKKA